METSFEIPGAVRLVTGSGGLPYYEIRTPLAEAHLYLHGAHMTHFAPARQEPLLFMSNQSMFQPGKPIRGGMPVIFPWFGPRMAPSHGFARTRSWTPESMIQQPGGEVVVTLRLEPDDETRALWDETWVLRHRVTIGSALAMELEIENRGTAPFSCEEMLHTYFRVSDIRHVCVHGLANVEYIDQCDGKLRKRQDASPIAFTGETDRDYLHTSASCVIEDPGFLRRIIVEKTGSQSTVVWNPWIDKSRAMPDFGDNEWPRMLCVETGNIVDNALEIAPGARRMTRTVVRSEPL